MWTLRRKEKRPSNLGQPGDIMEEEASNVGFKAKAESRISGHCTIQAENMVGETLLQNTNNRAVFNQAHPEEAFSQRHLRRTISSLLGQNSVDEAPESEL